ncbi:CsgG/HfaB family protein [Spongiimicrobium salis]|uniref:CsgG/HfaB family protein n=1 Tax=Spongiimicrobium salis TaxID=1667022 RepID=UPI00374CE55D
MKKCLLPLFFISCFALAQKPTMALQSFEAANRDSHYAEAEILFQKIKQVFVNSKRFSILDRESLGIVLDEQEIQKQITSINAKVVEQGRIAGAEHVIGGKLLSLEYKKVKPKIIGKSKDLLFRASFVFSIDIISTETSETIQTQTFKKGVLDLKSYGGITEREAFQNALNSIDKKIKKYLNEFLPTAINIVTIEEQNDKKGAQTLLINAGTAGGVKKNDKLTVHEITIMNIGGKDTKREKWIADLKIKAVEGEELSIAQVTKGGKELLKKLNDNAVLICKLK